MDQRRLAGDEAAALEKVRPHGEERLGDRRRLDHAEAARHGKRVGLVDLAIFGIATAWHQRRHRLADAETGCLGTGRRHLAGDLEAGYIRGAGRRRILPAPLHHIGPVHTRRPHPHQDLPRPKRRQRPLLGDEHLGPAGRTNGDHGHHVRQDGCGHQQSVIGNQ